MYDSDERYSRMVEDITAVGAWADHCTNEQKAAVKPSVGKTKSKSGTYVPGLEKNGTSSDPMTRWLAEDATGGPWCAESCASTKST